MDVKNTTVKGYDLILRQFAVFLRDSDIENVQLSDVMEWFGLMRSLGWDHNSFIPRAMALRKFFEFYEHQGVKVVDPWLIPIPNKEYKMSRVASEENYKKLLLSIPEATNDPRHIRNKAFINLLWDTGARNEEICSLDVGDLDLERKRAIIKTEKSRGVRPVREIFWTGNTSGNIKRWIEKRKNLVEKISHIEDKEALFISVCNQRIGRRMTNRGICEMLRKYSNRAGLPYMNAHSFRHRMGHHIIKSGGSNSDVANILGHSSLQSSFVYTQMNNIELEERYRSFMEVEVVI